MRLAYAASIIVILISFVIGSYFYPVMPESMASHWNTAGNANGYMPKIAGLFLMPVISILLFVLFVVIPRVDPLKGNIKKFEKYFNVFIVLLMLFLLYVYILTIVWSLGHVFNMVQLLSPAFAVLFFYCGILVENAKRNWSIGIRTPWTLSSEQVWTKVHKQGGKLFKAVGVISLLGALFPNYAIFLLLVPILVVVIWTFAYSYHLYRKAPKKRRV